MGVAVIARSVALERYRETDTKPLLFTALVPCCRRGCSYGDVGGRGSVGKASEVAGAQGCQNLIQDDLDLKELILSRPVVTAARKGASWLAVATRKASP